MKVFNQNRWALALMVAFGLNAPVAPAFAADLALVGGDIYLASGKKLENATVVISRGRISRIGKGAIIPKGAKSIDCRGKWITPGFIDAMTQVGLVEVSLESSTVDGRPSKPDPIRSAIRVDDAVNMRSSLVAVARRHGVTSVVSRPEGGLISGRSSWLDLMAPSSPSFDRAVSAPIAMHAVAGEAAARSVFGSRAAAMTHLAEVFDDARVFSKNRKRFFGRDLYDLTVSRRDLEALGSVLKGRMPFIVRAQRASDIQAVLWFARRERIRIGIVGAAEGWLVADELAKARVPVLVDPLANLPSSFEARNARSDNAALLAKAGVRLGFSTMRTHNVSDLRFVAGAAIRNGVPRDKALAAVTAVPAQMFGLGARYGELRRGYIANVVVWSGDPFEPASRAETVIVRGEVQPTASRQSQLAERYIRKLGLIR
ncbi:MAG: amidohydrolase family protein [Myxococcota bacterium]